MALDAGKGVEALASQPTSMRWVSDLAPADADIDEAFCVSPGAWHQRGVDLTSWPARRARSADVCRPVPATDCLDRARPFPAAGGNV